MEQFFTWLSEQPYLLKATVLVVIAIIQNISFTVVSRSRNRDNKVYHVIAAIFSNGIYFLVFKVMMSNDFAMSLMVPYIIGTVTGSVLGMKVSMIIEKVLGASADGHLLIKKDADVTIKGDGELEIKGNVCIGYASLKKNSTGTNSVKIGKNA